MPIDIEGLAEVLLLPTVLYLVNDLCVYHFASVQEEGHVQKQTCWGRRTYLADLPDGVGLACTPTSDGGLASLLTDLLHVKFKPNVV